MNNSLPTKNTNGIISYKAGVVIFPEGQSPKFLYLVKSGKIHLVKKNGQHLHIISLCKEKEILNEVSVLTNQPTEFAAIAKTEVELVAIDQKDIMTALKNGPSWIPEMFETLCERLKATQEIVDEHNLMAGEKNADTVISIEDEKKYKEALEKYH